MKFRCNASGNIYEFTLPIDIKSMLENPEYTKVEEDEALEEAASQADKTPKDSERKTLHLKKQAA